jgi:hypothetical protein
VTELKTAQDLLQFNFSDEKNHRCELLIGTFAQKEIRFLKDSDRKYFLRGVKKFYLFLAEYLKKNLPLKSKDLADLRCLNPLNRDQAAQESVLRLASKLPPGCGLEVPLPPKLADALALEMGWYALEKVPEC